MLHARAQTPVGIQSCRTGAPSSRCSCKDTRQPHAVVDEAVTYNTAIGHGRRAGIQKPALLQMQQPWRALNSAATACFQMYATSASLIRVNSARHSCVHGHCMSIAAASRATAAAAASAAVECCRPSQQLLLHVTHHAGVMLLYMHGVGSLARSSSEVYQPMPKPSPLRLPKPRWLGSDGSCKRSRASYDCLMIDRSGPAHAHTHPISRQHTHR
jgi:hypothetical protein